MNHPSLAYVCAAFGMMGFSRQFEQAADSDLAYVLRVQYKGTTPPKEELDRRRKEIRTSTATYRRTLQRKTIYSFLWVVAAAALAFWIVVLPTLATGARPTTQQVCGAASVVMFAWGTLGRLGWRQGSYGGVTVFEELDTILFWLLYALGTFFGIAALASAA